MDEIVFVEIKQEISPEGDWLKISPEIIKTDLDDVVKTEDHYYCLNYDEECSNNLPSENRLFLKEENASLGVAEVNLVNKIDIDQQEVPTHDESAFKQWVKEEQGVERRENALDEKILVDQKLDLTDLKTEINLDNVVVKSEDQFCINCDENSSDNLPSENELVSKVSPSAEAVQRSETLEPEYDSDVNNLINRIDYDQQDVSRQAFFQENAELQTDVINLKQAEKKKRGNRNKTSVGKEKRFKCHYCAYETHNASHLREHVSMIHERGNAKLYYCQQCSFKTVRERTLRAHFGVHEEKALHKCPACGKCFNRKAYWNSHLLMNHDSLRHLITCRINYCQFCTYKTINSKDLSRHIAHNHDKDGAEKFQCHKCDYVALQKGNLRRHVLIHSNWRPHLCTLCRKRFNEKKTLDYHILSKHEDNADLLNSITNKIHQCTFCTFKTIVNRNLRKHMNSEHKQIST